MSLPNLIIKIKKYQASKKNTGHDEQKRIFFKNIIRLYEENDLTVDSLTEWLKSFTEHPESWVQLFWRARVGKASANSQAAQLLGELYRELNVPMDDAGLKRIVEKGLKNDKSGNDTFWNALTNYPYRNWRKHPFSKITQNALDRELKGLLSLRQEDYQNKNLTESLKIFLEKDLNGFKKGLNKLAKKAPDYLSQILHDLYHQLQPQEVSSALVPALTEVVVQHHDPAVLFKSVSESHPAIAAALVQAFISKQPPEPKWFFELSFEMQQAVQKLLQKNGDSASLKTIKDFVLKNNLIQEVNGGSPDPLTRLEEASKIIYRQLPGEKATLVANHLITPAINAITAYLAQQPNTYKAKFFNKLAASIQEKGLTTEVLQKALESSRLDPRRLFAKWSGAQNSRAMDLMLQLYKLANLIDPKEEKEFRQKGFFDPLGRQLKPRSNLVNKYNEFLQKKVKDGFMCPAKFNSELEKTIVKQTTDYHDYTAFLQRDDAYQQKEVEAKFQQALIGKALKLVEGEKDIIFDPQGHLIVAVELEPIDYQTIMADFPIDNRNKEGLEKILGKPITTTTLCNIDIAAFPPLRDKFKQSVAGAEEVNEELNTVLENFLNSQDRSSVIALQEEMMMHVSLCLRGLEKDLKQLEGKSLLTPDSRKTLMVAINKKVLEEFAIILMQSKEENGNIDYRQLNKLLDGARKKLAPACREQLIEAIHEVLKNNFDALNSLIQKNLQEHLFTGTTATGWDYLRTDSANHSVTHISATNETAHNKRKGAQTQALRWVSRNYYDSEKGVTPYMETATEARVPSIAVIDLKDQQAKEDVQEKLRYAMEKLRPINGCLQGPVIYNLLTSLHTQAYDHTIFERNNRQRSSAERILKGAHLFNREQIKKGESKALVYVQNIPVNQHTNELSLSAFDDATSEAALMTDIALLATFTQHADAFPPLLRKSITHTFSAVNSHYVSFLSQAGDDNHYFQNSKQGKEAIELLRGSKNQWDIRLTAEKNGGETHIGMRPAKNLQSLVVQALFKMMARNEHQNKQFGMLTQALSVFAEEMSLAGCKSANERYQAVSGRVGLLKCISQEDFETLSDEKKAVWQALENYVLDSPDSGPQVLQEKLDIAYNRHNLQGAVAAISEEDQGAASKIKATKNSKKGEISEWFDTNCAESGFLDRLYQEYSASMQAHKAHLAKVFIDLFQKALNKMPSPLSHSPRPSL
jgi:hypothetical protein